ncbi:MAG: MarR family transcriptional regulator [Pseudomonadota bacterium]
MATPAKDRSDVRVMSEIAIIAQLSNARLDRSLPAGLSAPQFGVLTHFMRRGGTESPARLAKAFQVTKGAMTNTLQRLEAQGYVTVIADEADGRRKLVSLTSAGARAFDAGVAAVRPHLEGLRSAFTEAEFQAALPFLTALRAWLDDER